MKYGRLGDSPHGEPISVDVANPAAGADWSYTLPANFAYKLQSVFATITTSGVSGTRIPRLSISDGAGNLLARIQVAGGTAGSLTHNYVWMLGVVSTTTSAELHKSMALCNMILSAGWVIEVATDLIQAGDQWSNIQLSFERWRL